MIFIQKDIQEGSYFPDAMISFGKVLPFNRTAPILNYFNIKLCRVFTTQRDWYSRCEKTGWWVFNWCSTGRYWSFEGYGDFGGCSREN